jgi:pimeloyl-[acyl-carrier protein] methyl ester esterase
MRYAFVLMHGWGSNADYWQNLIQHLDRNDYFLYEQGYFFSSGNNQTSRNDLYNFIEKHKDDQIIGIGHSIGFIKLLETNIDFDYIFGLQSFTNFLGSDSTLKFVTENFKNFMSKFITNTSQALKESYISSRIYEYFDEALFGENNINYSLLMKDLQSLKENKSYLLNKISDNYHIFGTHDDLVVPSFIIKDNFPENKITFLDINSGHSLGIFHSELISQEIFKKLQKIDQIS